MVSDVTLEAEKLKVAGTINGQQIEAETAPEKVYGLYSFIETLELEKNVVPAGKPPRGATRFHLTYKDGHSITLALNPNEEGLEYYELSIEQFQQLQDKWMNL